METDSKEASVRALRRAHQKGKPILLKIWSSTQASPQLQWLTWWREAAAAVGRCNQTRGANVVKDQLLGRGHYANLQSRYRWMMSLLGSVI